MEFKRIDIDNSAKRENSACILIIYTGGTFGMAYDDRDGLIPFNFREIMINIPVLDKFDLHFAVSAAKEPLDSSNLGPVEWTAISNEIIRYYDKFDGFVILHGTDTMAYSASALSFLLRGIEKPVILTGAQIPIGAIRSDARENLITAIEIASTLSGDKPMVQEVCIYFNEELLRGNRSVKIKSSEFGAFASLNYPILAKAGINIEYNEEVMLKVKDKDSFIEEPVFDGNVNVLRMYPGLNESSVEAILATKNMRGLIIESYGSGNMSTEDWFLEKLTNAIDKGLLIVNVSQCIGGKIDQGKYYTSRKLNEIGVISGKDITTEAALSKLMLLFGQYQDRDEIAREFQRSWAGEITE